MAGRPVPPRSSAPPPPPPQPVDGEEITVPTMSPSLARFAPAFVRVQAALQPVAKRALNPHFGNNFADLASILDEALPLLNNNGFALLQFPSTLGNQLALLSILAHESGEFISSTMPLLLQKQDPQGEGSAITYGRRYAACAILGIRTADDDGNDASNRAHSEPDRTPAQRPGRQAPPQDEPPAPKAEGWADAAAESSAHKAAAEQIKQLYALIPDDHPFRAEVKAYRDEHGWPMAANDLMNLSMKVAKAHGEATASAGQETPPPAQGAAPRPEAPAPVPAAPSASTVPADEMPWDGLPGEAAPDSMSVCPWCEHEVEKGQPSVITGGKNADDPVVRWHKDHYAEMQAEQEEQG